MDWVRRLSEPRMIYAGPNLTVEFMGYQVIGKEVFNDFSFRIRPDGRPTHVRVLDRASLKSRTVRRQHRDLGFDRGPANVVYYGGLAPLGSRARGRRTASLKEEPRRRRSVILSRIGGGPSGVG